MLSSWTLLVLLYYQNLVYGTDPEVSKRVYNGTRVKPGEFPFQAVIYSNRFGPPLCAGSIISRKHVLTAEMCFGTVTTPWQLECLSVGVGSIVIHGENEIQYAVVNIIRHEGFPDIPKPNIALVETKPIFHTATIMPIRIIGSGAQRVSTATVFGYGRLYGQKDFARSEVLMKGELQMLDYRDLGCRKIMKRDQICAVDPIIWSDTCLGDIGGPLIIGKYLVGIVIGGQPCGKFGNPALFTAVAYYGDWIMDKIYSKKREYQKDRPT